MRNLIKFEACIGVNRVYLLSWNKKFIWLSYIYSLSLVCFTSGFILSEISYNASHLIFKDTTAIEHVLLCVSSLVLQGKLKLLLESLREFDGYLGIEDQTSRMSPKYSHFIMFLLFYDIVGFILSYECLHYQFYSNVLVYFSLLSVLVHDAEMIFFTELLVMILRRVEILKVYIEDKFRGNQDVCNNMIEGNKTNSFNGVSFLYKMYNLIHACSELLSFILSFPMLMMFFSSAISTVMLLNNVASFMRQNDDELKIRSVVLFGMGRCFKYSILFVLPCHYSSLTTRQASIIRSKLHKVLCFSKLNKGTRRQVKALYQLTRDNEFLYSIGGVIGVNMSLPLAYCGLCITYLIIVLQFSKMFE